MIRAGRAHCPGPISILHSIGVAGFFAVSGLALVNAVLPIGLLWLAARRRPWTLRLLMALPIAAAVPLWVFQTVEPMIPVQIGSTPVSARVVFVLGTVAGLPIVLYAGFAVSCLDPPPRKGPGDTRGADNRRLGAHRRRLVVDR